MQCDQNDREEEEGEYELTVDAAAWVRFSVSMANAPIPSSSRLVVGRNGKRPKRGELMRFAGACKDELRREITTTAPAYNSKLKV